MLVILAEQVLRFFSFKKKGGKKCKVTSLLKFDEYVLSTHCLQCGEPLSEIWSSVAHGSKLVTGNEMALFTYWEFSRELHWKSWGALPRGDKEGDIWCVLSIPVIWSIVLVLQCVFIELGPHVQNGQDFFFLFQHSHLALMTWCCLEMD